ncbi:PA0069 family radical SAM protein [Bordetella tumulicola]|uniref:PA0069 family radical SAM protein n=1 Tax=Bordetella tumulicola TaxID=1649133 RepID=UPI0039EFE281
MERTDYVFSAGSGSPATAPAALRGRGAVTNVQHRFQQAEREPVDDGWSSGQDDTASQGAVSEGDGCGGDLPGGYIPIVAQPAPKTTVAPEQARKLLSRNDSPDIPFDVAVNPYRGCEHGCVYCYARPTHAYLGYSPGLDFETRLVAKANAVDVLRAELARPGYRVSPINIGSATDVYQPIERQWQLTRGILDLLWQTRHPATVVTKNALIERDLDLLRLAAEQHLITVYISITTLDIEMARTLEPRASAPWRRLQAVRTLADAGVPVGVLVAPVIPFINDESLEHILQAARQAGACYASYTVVRLPWEVKAVFEEWLETHFPDRAQRVLHRIEDLRNGRRNDSRFGTRMRGTGLWADLLRQRFNLAVRKLGLNTTRPQLATHLFQAPRVADSASHAMPASGVGQGTSRQSRSSLPLSSSPQLALF